jgi:hypothetical protein
MKCPHCDKHISSRLVRSAAAKLDRAKQTTPNPKMLSPCAHRGELKGVRELRVHLPACPRNPRLMHRTT